MPVGTSSFGAYTWTYAGTTIGLIEGAPELVEVAEAIDRRSGLTGSTVIDGIYTGNQMFLTLIVKEWTAAIKTAIWPFGTMGLSGRHGRSMLDLCSQIIATAVAGTPAATNGPATRTLPKCLFAPGFNKRTKFGIEERNIPITFRVYPTISESTGDATFYTDT